MTVVGDNKEITGFYTKSVWVRTNNVIVAKGTTVSNSGLQLLVVRPLADNPAVRDFINNHTKNVDKII